MGIEHPSHPKHPLVICKKADYSGKRCVGCGELCIGMVYGCQECDFFLGNSCLDLPFNIFHHSHPDHCLTLLTSGPSFHCSSCSASCSGFSFRCSSGCDFSLDVHCAVPPSLIKCKFHLHRLSFFDKWKWRSLSCNFCGKPCESLVLHCAECQFTIHLLCGPLPRMIRYKNCHEDRLTFTRSREVDKDDSDHEKHFYCDVCDEDVELHSPAYICRGCHALAHITCVINEVLTSMKSERAVKLVSISEKAEQDGQIAEKPEIETLESIMSSFNEREEEDLDKIRKRRVAEIVRTLAFRKNFTLSRIPSPFMDEVFVEFMERLNKGLNILQQTDPLAFYEEYSEEVVAVREHKVTWKLAPVLEDLFANHGDVSAQSGLHSDSKVKIYVFVVLCWTIYSMLNTKMGEISEGLLYQWWRCLILVYSSGFDITFAINRLKVVVRAHYSLQDKNNVTAKLDKEIADLKDEIDELKQKLKDKEDKLNKRNRKRESRGTPTDESLMEAYASKALAWKW